MKHASEIAKRQFGFGDGEFRVGGVPVGEIAEEFGTPLFVYDRGVMERKMALLQSTLGKHFRICYSVKANPSQAVIRFFLSRGCGLEVASGGELFQAIEAGADPSRVLFAGPGKSLAEIEYAIRSGIGEIHVESTDELDRLEETGRKTGIRARVAVRVNPGAEAQGGAMQMGGKAAPFGIDEEKLENVVGRMANSKVMDFSGVHIFTGTQILDHRVLLRQYRKGMDIARNIAVMSGKPLRTVDFGGGLGIPYFTGDKELDLVALDRELSPILAGSRKDKEFAEAEYVIEPGRYLVGESGIYVTRVNSVKSSRGKKYLVVDGGLNHHLAASGNFGQVIKRNFPILLLNRWNEEPVETVDIVGPLCTPLDVLGRDVRFPPADRGDLVGILQSGAYARSASPAGFLSHPSPPEILAGDGKARLIRRRGTFGDLLSDQVPGGSGG